MFSDLFFRSNTTTQEIEKAKLLACEIAEDIRVLKEKISVIKLQREAAPKDSLAKAAIEETPVMTKAQEMVYHLKHTKNSISLN